MAGRGANAIAIESECLSAWAARMTAAAAATDAPGEGPSDPVALSARAARMVVAAASTDPRGEATRKVAQLLGRDDQDRVLLAELLLDQTHDQLKATAGQERERARAALEAVWRGELTDLLVESPEKAGELPALVAQIRTELNVAMCEAHKTARKHEQWRDALQPLPQIFDWYKANAIAGTLLAAGFVILKGYVIARGDTSTALGILQYAGLATVVTAGLLTTLPILTAAMLANTLCRTIRTWRGWRPGNWRLAVVTASAIVLAGLFAPWTYLPFAVMYGGLFGAMQRPDVRERFSSRSKPRKSVTVAFVALVGIPAVLLFGLAVIVSLYSVWVPHEIVTFRPHILPGGRTQEVDYVLSEDGGWTTLLATGPGEEHAILRVPDAAVKNQTVCERKPMNRHFWSIFLDAGTLWRVATGVNTYWGVTVIQSCPYGAINAHPGRAAHGARPSRSLAAKPDQMRSGR